MGGYFFDLILRVIVVGAADGASEFSESLADGPAGFGESFGSQNQERDDQDDDYVGGLEDAGEHGAVLR
jgi:hypothetical protein